MNRIVNFFLRFFSFKKGNDLRNDRGNIYESKYLKVEKNTIIKSNSRIRFDLEPLNKTYIEIGSKGIIAANFIFESTTGEIKIGNNVHIGFATIISKSQIIIGDDVTMAWDIILYDHDSHSIDWEFRKNDNSQCYKDYMETGNNIINKNWSNVKSSPIKICDKVWIGFGVTILKGVEIGEGAVIGAKSVVTKNVPPWTVVAGNPAKVVKYIKCND